MNDQVNAVHENDESNANIDRAIATLKEAFREFFEVLDSLREDDQQEGRP